MKQSGFPFAEFIQQFWRETSFKIFVLLTDHVYAQQSVLSVCVCVFYKSPANGTLLYCWAGSGMSTGNGHSQALKS